MSVAPWRGLLLVCLAGLLWGTIGPAVDVVHDRSPLSPLTIGAYRSVSAIGALLVAVLVTRRWGRCVALVRRHGARALLVGLLTASFQLLFFVGVVQVGVSITTVVALGLPPLLLLALGSYERRSAPARGELLTVLTAVAGLLLVSLAGDPAGLRPGAALGLLAAVGSGAAYAFSAHVAAPVSRSSDGLTVTAVTMSVVALVLVPGGLALAAVRHEPLVTDDAPSWLLVAYLGVVTMAFAYVLLFDGLRTTPSGSAVVATLLEPVTAVLIAVAFLGERLSLAGVIGSLLILAAIGSLGRRTEEPPPQ